MIVERYIFTILHACSVGICALSYFVLTSANTIYSKAGYRSNLFSVFNFENNSCASIIKTILEIFSIYKSIYKNVKSLYIHVILHMDRIKALPVLFQLVLSFLVLYDIASTRLASVSINTK